MESYAAGIEAATGTRFVFDRNRGRRLAAVLDAHGPNGESTGAEREAWVRDAAEAFARAADPKYGYSVGRFLAWLNAGRPVSRERPEAPETEAHTMSRPMSEEEKRRLLAEEEAFRAEVAARAGPDRAREIAPPVPLAEAAVLAGADALGSALEGLGASGPTCTADRQPGETEAAYIDRRRTEQLTALAELDLAHEDD